MPQVYIMPPPDIYCFVCCGPIYNWRTGSSSPGALSRRRRWVEQQRLALMEGEDFDTDASDPEDDFDGTWDSDEEKNIYDYKEHRSYDFILASRKRTASLRDLRALGSNSLASGSTKYGS